jgi:hypothetical protein
LVGHPIYPSSYLVPATLSNIILLEAKIDALSQEFKSIELKQLLDKASTSISNLSALYHDGDVFFKREIVNAICPQRLEYDGNQFRTTHLNEVIATTFSLDARFQKEKSRQNGAFSILSAKEVSSIQFSNYFMLDLKRLAALSD